ncbi:Guanyl-specific ribonuclease Sa [Corynebacterium gerontici]|uniref:Guanyl-specific ribonuclease Sa n=2 Tax=Corynebacterium gerontici TaxID=2079234 RepID=A0A3G6J1N2_9CORY|nr:ribonuclease domain-containing protein [Corynebacterium gerontici]AZA11869.1 Guanyl-specific ribonuclease Sa [Corynebacterium gerontici]
MASSDGGNKPKRSTHLAAAIAGAASVAVAAYLGISSGEHVESEHDATSKSSDVCPVDSLPKEADEVIDSILSGGPYEHPGDDGSHFGNYEHLLPEQSSNYYREFTVDTPGLRHRGERRIVVGGGTKTDPHTWYYTDNHYESFCAIPDAES